jgi:hypothetical protein
MVFLIRRPATRLSELKRVLLSSGYFILGMAEGLASLWASQMLRVKAVVGGRPKADGG